MDRNQIIQTIGIDYKKENIENSEYSYVKACSGGKKELEKLIERKLKHFKLDIRFAKDDFVILVETKQRFTSKDEEQLKEYVELEKALHHTRKIVAILANTKDNNIKVFKNFVDDEHHLANENTLKSLEYYEELFSINKTNDREQVLANTYKLNEILHSLDIDEKIRSQLVGTTLLYIKKFLHSQSVVEITKETTKAWESMTPNQIIVGIKDTLENLLDDSENKAKKVELLQKNVLEDQKVKNLTKDQWLKILTYITINIYKFIDMDSMEGQDILNLFFIAFNKYTGKADKNQAFTPDHITEFMCRVCEIDKTKRVLDPTCGSGSFLVQAMVKELADCKRNKTLQEAIPLMDNVKQHNIVGIEIEEKAFGLAATNMLIHGDGNSNIKFGSCFEFGDFIKEANPDIILMNPPYNAKPINIPEKYRVGWTKNASSDPTKGLVFVQYISDIIKELNDEQAKEIFPPKLVKMAVLLPMQCAIGNSNILKDVKSRLLLDNTLEAVFSLPDDMFYPGANVCPCCMVFTLGKPHINLDGVANETFFGYYKNDGFRKKKNLGRVEQFNEMGDSKWKAIENDWIRLFRNKSEVDGLSAKNAVGGDDEWLCEAYMNTDYSNLDEHNFRKSINNYLANLVKSGKYPNITIGTNNKTPVLDVDNWKNFVIRDLFEVSLSRGDLKESECEIGEIPLISSGESDNGIVKYIDKNGDGKAEIFSGNKITVDMFCNAFYQPSDFYAVSHGRVNILSPKFEMCVKIGLFITTLINLEQYRYSYGRAVYSGVISKMCIKLPVKNNNKDVPDWDFMKEYMSSLPYGSRL